MENLGSASFVPDLEAVKEDETVLTMTDGQMVKPFEGSDDEFALIMVGKEGEMFARSDYLSSEGYASPYIQTNMPYRPYGNTDESGIYDADGDGVEDNMKFEAK